MTLCNPCLGGPAVGHALDLWLAHHVMCPMVLATHLALACIFTPGQLKKPVIYLAWIDKRVLCMVTDSSSKSEDELFVLATITKATERAEDIRMKESIILFDFPSLNLFTSVLTGQKSAFHLQIQNMF